MTIDKEQLISLLIDKTGLEPEQVENQLSELINRIQQAAEKGKTFEVEGFGVFNMEDENLQFEPHDRLETEINNKYAGMKPIELIGAFKEPEGDEVPEMPKESPLHQSSETEDGRWTFDEEADPAAESEQDESADEDQPEEELVEQEETRQEGSSAPEASETETEEDDFDEVFGTEEDESGNALEEQITEQQNDAEPASKSEKEPDTLGRILVAAVVIIALGVGGWFVYDIGFAGNDGGRQMSYLNNSSTKSSVQQTKDTRQEPAKESPSQTSGDKTSKNSEPEQAKEVVKQGGSQTNSEKEQPTFGLKGTMNQSAGGYTIVVHSLRSMRKADNNRKELEEAGFRALTSEAQVGGTTYYRVGIGQFESIRNAQRAMSELPQRYRENNFIKRIH